MNRILILGGGVGGTLTANLLIRKLRRQVKAGEVTHHGRRPDRPAHLPAGVHVHRAWAASGPSNLQRPERGLLDPRVAPRGRRGREGRRAQPDRRTSPTASASPTTSSSLRRDLGSCPRRSSTSTPRPITSTPPRPRSSSARRSMRSRGGRIVIGIAGHALQVPAGAARGRIPHRGGAPPARPAREERAPLLLADRAGVHHRERVRDGDPDPRAEGHRAAHVLQRRDDRRRPQGRPEPRGRGAPV